MGLHGKVNLVCGGWVFAGVGA